MLVRKDFSGSSFSLQKNEWKVEFPYTLSPLSSVFPIITNLH